ncbi:hypothetical protein COCVIDRAFT_97629 [Bipolaris victoriae FI3]|uniref:Uncharacterized protein n=2 Tax=Bipolaris TaxID=33194 RepID=W6YFJ0_COCC2|nr:uncharacterized protein COCCADRAFT_83596 [Bipolaris zeicola 26-R-13]XP_014557297.1 hypothetical protein COCVIDRAFT_97629 [Bipolaris victoriae FI3]EUC38242.1 hypothetical protein COCCADRAFT_83596 [Bipolaris zeicola 26-R-13]
MTPSIRLDIVREWCMSEPATHVQGTRDMADLQIRMEVCSWIAMDIAIVERY